MTEADSETYRQRLYELRAADDLPVATKLDRLLALGCEYLGVENGHVKRVDPAQGVHYVVASVGEASDFIRVGDVQDHATTFCRRAVERDSPLAISHAAEQGWEDDPAYEAHGLECYLGTTIVVGTRRFGTLCFVSRQPRAAAFSAEERTFVELLANIIGSELATHRHLETLTELDKHLAVLHRVLRHNLRNDMNVVAGYADMLAGRLDGDNRRVAERIGEAARDLATMGDTARRLEAIIREDPGLTTADVVPLVETVAADLREASSAATVSTTLPETALVVTTEHLRAALEELGTNALHHAGPNPTVEFAVEHLNSEGVAISVSDDGPGMPPMEQRILRGQQETPLDHGQGLGLWLVYWVVTRAGGHLTVDTDGGTTVEVYLRAAEEEGDARTWARQLFLEPPPSS